MDSKTSFLTFLLFMFLFSHIPLSDSTFIISDSLPFSSSPSLPTLAAERLIKSFNLKPARDVNVIPEDGYEAPKLVEREFNLPAAIDSARSPSLQDLGHHAGYYKLPNSKAARLFYFFFESRSSKADPVVIWLTGGPGCGSELAMFYENGPFTISNDSSLAWNNFGWDKASNIIYVDQPVGTGFSYTSDKSDLRHDEDGVSNDLYDFLQAFFKEHPQFVKNDFYITGESYAGHYIPALASRVHRGNKNKEGTHINLKGFAIGNGLTNPEIQYGAYADYALDMKLISQSDHSNLTSDYITCQQSIKKCNTDKGEACSSSYVICDNLFQKMMHMAGNINFYDVRKQCIGSLCYDFSTMEKFLNQDSVRKALGVGDIKFVSCSTVVYDAMQMDWMQNLEVGIPSLLEDGIKMLIYAGEYDLICNWLGNSKWVHEMEWSGQKEFVSAATVPFYVDNKEAGLMKNHGSLTFLKVHDAGHMVPMDQPKAALQMLQNWMEGKLDTPTGRTARK